MYFLWLLLLCCNVFCVDPFAINDSIVLQGAAGEFLAANASGAIVSIPTSVYNPSSHMKVIAYDAAAKTLILQIGNNYLVVANGGLAVGPALPASGISVNIDTSTNKISFLSLTTPINIPSAAGRETTVFSIAQKITADTAVFDQSLVAMQGVLTKDIVVANLLNVFQPFMIKPQKSIADWTFFVNFLTDFLTKASTDIAQWKVPSIDVVSQGQTRRISLCDYASVLVQYVADPFSPAPADVQAKARTLLQTLTAQTPQASPTQSPALSMPFVQGGLVLLQSTDGLKTLLINAQGVAQFLAGVTKFNPLVQAQVAAYNASPASVKLSFSGRFFDQSNMAFSLTNGAAAPSFTIEPASDASVCYLSLGQGKRLVIGDSFASGCSLNALGTPFKITALNAVYSSLPPIKNPATPQEFENSLKAYIAAFDLLKDSADDMSFVFQGLRDYCTAVAALPDWSLQMSGAIIVNDSPLNYVKTSLQTMLTLSSRYSGLTNDLKSAIQQFLTQPLFTPMQISSALATGARCILKIDDSTALTVDVAGICRGQTYTNLLDPSIHGVIDRFDPATLSLNLSLTGKKMGINAANQLSTAATYGAMRVITEGQTGYLIVNAQNKKLRYNPTAQAALFADTGALVQITLISADRCLLDGISGDVVRDIKAMESALLQVRASGNDVNFIVDKLVQLAKQASQSISWYTTTGIDPRNTATTTRDYTVLLLKRVRDSSTIFTAVSQALKDKISAAVTALQDNTLLYSQQINTLDGLAAKLSDASTITTSCELVQTLTGLIDKVVAGSNVTLRSTLLQKVSNYCDSGVVAGLAQASDTAKVAWDIQMVRFMDKLLSFDAADADAWEGKFDSVKNNLFARILGAPTTEKPTLMQIVFNSSVKKLVAEGVGMSAQLTSWRSLKQQLNNFLFDISQQLTAMSDQTQMTALTDAKKSLNALLLVAGILKNDPAVDTQLSQPVPNPTPSTPQVVPTPAPVVEPAPQQRRSLIAGLIATSESSEWAPRSSSGPSDTSPTPVNLEGAGTINRGGQLMTAQSKLEI